MTRTFRPRLDTLPTAQQRLWPALRDVAGLGFTLYGGTAIALRLGHRESVDFDFFTEKTLDRQALSAAFPELALATTLQEQDDAWVVLVPVEDGEPSGAGSRDAAPRDPGSRDPDGGYPEPQFVKLSFFGGISFGRVGEPEFSEDGVLRVASLDDLMATKLKVILQRAEAKDYRDIVALLGAGVSMAHGLAAARTLYGPNFQPSESLKALVFYDDGDLQALSDDEKNVLVEAVKVVRDFPEISLLSTSLA